MAATTRPASDKQISFISRLLDERQHADADRFRKLTGDGARISSRHASEIIDILMAAPHADPTPAAADTPRRSQPAEVGVYRHDDTLYVVREFTPQGESRKVRYARKLVQLGDGQADRLNGAGARVRYDEQRAPGMQFELQPAELLSVSQVEALSVEWGQCLLCSRALKVAESVQRGVGPVCAGRQSAALELAI